MKPVFPETKRKRIILIYALAIVLPGVLMGIMAYQGILNDQARRAQESHERLSTIADDFFYALDSMQVSELNAILNDNSNINKYPDFIRLAFVQTEDPDIHLLHHHLIYVPDSIEPTFPDEEDDALMDRIQQVREMAQGGKTGRQEAKEGWEKIKREYKDYLISNKIPVLLVAQFEELKVLVQMNLDSEIESALKEFYETLLNPPVCYEASQYRFFMTAVDELMIPLSHDVQELKNQLIEKALETDFLSRILRERDPVFLQSKQDPAWPGISRFSFLIDSLPCLYLSIQTPGNETVGCMLNVIPFVRENSDKIMHKLDPLSKLNWEISYSTTSAYSPFSFSAYYPNWKLNLSEKELNFPASILSKGQGPYLLVFAFIIGLMLIGLGFTLYTLNNELKLNRLKSDFISNVSHELKSPLTSMRHLTDLLDKNRVKTEEQKRKYYATMLEQSEHLSYLIDNILDFSRLEDDRKKYNFVEVDVVDFVGHCIGMFEERSKQMGIKITQKLDKDLPPVSIDRDAMQQVVFNLLDNAIKYSGESKKVVIYLDFEGKGQQVEGKNWGKELREMRLGNHIILSVRDWGMGISKQDQGKIFERFYRSEETLEKGIRGSGIGLTIARRIVEAHHGSISLESAVGKGSTFFVHLPISSQAND